MKEFLHLETVTSSDTYLGTRMNQKALDFHTQLHDWSEAQKLSALASRHASIFSSAKNGEVFLPVKKLAQIEYWTRQVNRYYRPHTSGRPKSGSFMKIDVTKYNMKVDKNEPCRSKSAIYPNRQRPVSAVNRLMSGPRKRFFGNDVHTVNNKLIESQMHYSAQRKDLYSAKTRKSTKSAKIDEVKSEFLENSVSEVNVPQNVDTDSQTVTNEDNNGISKISDLESQGQTHIDTEVMQPQIVSRSWSNRMLNVISIDDCKLTCRYRPQMIKENHQIPDDLDAMQKARANKMKYEMTKVNNIKVKVKEEQNEENGNEADDEAQTSEDTADALGSMEKLSLNEVAVDTNNIPTANACHTGTSVSDETNDRTVETNNLVNTESSTENVFEEITKRKSTSSESTEKSDRHLLRIPLNNELNGRVQMEDIGNSSSQAVSKTSYGRITTLYSNSESLNSKVIDEKKKKKISRTSRINFAINDMVKERKVMNSLDRDFNTRTAEFGRTIVDKTEGSETFRKIHANLRKKIDAFVDTHSAVKTKEFYEKSRSNSAANSLTSP